MAKRTFGEIIPGLEIGGKPAPYPVVNERVVRAMAGIMLLMATVGFVHDNMIAHQFVWLKFITVFFLVDFLSRMVFGPTRSPIGFMAEWAMRHHEPEWTGALQKRFAWTIGLAISVVMSVIANMGQNGTFAITMCMICIGFMWLEAAFSYCAGCTIYKWAIKLGLMTEPEYRPACPGNSCGIDF